MTTTTQTPRYQIGKAISILIAAQNRLNELHEDVDAFGAPGECHDLVARGEAGALRQARRHAIAVSGCRSMREIKRRARAVMGNDAPIYRRYGFVPY